MTTQPELPQVAPPLARPARHLAPVPGEGDLDFDGFVRTFEGRLRRLVLRRIGDLSEAEEITQETLLRAYQHRASFASEDELMAWSTVVAQRLVIDRVRVRGRSIAVAEVPEAARLGRDTADIVVARHEARAALESLEAIPTRQAAILWAREVEGLHYEEIADRFGITEPAVRSLLHRGRKALRKEFKDRTGSVPLNGLVPFAPWLMALKAAGRVRGAAKAVTKSSISTAAALSLSALVVTGIGGGGAPSAAPDVRIDSGSHGATYVTPAAGPADAVEGMAGWTLRARGDGVDRPGPTDKGGSGDYVQQCVSTGTRGLCATAGQGLEFKGAVIQIGPDIEEENPADLKNVSVSLEDFDCPETDLPPNQVVSCTQNGPRNGSPLRNPQTPSSSTPEGALR